MNVMGREKFDRLMPEFFCALGRLYEKHPAFFWSHLRFVVEDLLRIFAYLQELKEYEDFTHGLDDLVVPLFEQFIHSEDPKALRELMEELARVRNYFKQELDFRNSPAHKLP
jgi:hypothetical protein